MRFSRGSSQPRSPALWADSLLSKPPGKPKNTGVGSLSLLQGNFWPRNQTRVSCIAGGFFTSWATREAPEKSRLRSPADGQSGAWKTYLSFWRFWRECRRGQRSQASRPFQRSQATGIPAFWGSGSPHQLLSSTLPPALLHPLSQSLA